MVRKFRRVDRPFEYIAHRIAGPFSPLPSWFAALERDGLFRSDVDGYDEVRVITGQWQHPETGMWVVMQRRQHWLWPFKKGGDVFLVEHEDFIKLWEEI